MGYGRRHWMRSLTAALVLSPLAGCLGDDSSTELSGVPELKPEGPPADYFIMLTPASDAEIAAFHLRPLIPQHEKLVEEIKDEGGSTTVTDLSPIGRDYPFFHEGTIYTFDHEEIGTTTGISVRFWFEMTDTVAIGRIPDEAMYTLRDLPEIDRTAIVEPIVSQELDPDQAWIRHTYLGDEISTSELVPEPTETLIELEDGWLLLEPGSVDEREYIIFEYSLEVYEDSPSDLGHELRAEYAHTVSGYDEAEAEILQTAIDEEHGYRGLGDDPSDAFFRLIDRIEAGDSLPPFYGADQTDTNQYLIDIDGELFWTTVSYRDHFRSTPTPA